MTDSVQKQIVELINRNEKILILPSSPADGDSLSSGIALYTAFQKLGKDVTVVLKDPVPEIFHFLPNIKNVGDKMVSSNDFIITINAKDREIENIKEEIEDDKINIIITPKKGRFSEEDVVFNKGRIEYDLVITVDCAELTQLGELYENNIELFYQIPIINIDHHVSNTHFGKINYIDIMASSTTELILPLLEELGRVQNKELIDEDIATLLLTGIITDTGSFQNANTTPRSFAKAAQLIAYGARQQEIIQNVYKTKQLSQLKLWGRILSKIQTDDDYRIVWSTVSQQDLKETDSSEKETGDVIDELMTNAPGAEVILLIKEKENGEISTSLRTTTPAVDASKIAENFGGGGHTQASGFRMKDISLRDAEYKIINFIKKNQSKRLGIIKEESSKHPEPQSKPKIELEPKPNKKPKSKPGPGPNPNPEKNKTKPKEIEKIDFSKAKSREEETYSTTETSYKFED
ncbi:hypothetical protein GF366_05055 [Candidatus Peregrinibacteria bacterium]|nr:hypothetical protein [Candidatus Peregrinibacteria bacterium]